MVRRAVRARRAAEVVVLVLVAVAEKEAGEEAGEEVGEEVGEETAMMAAYMARGLMPMHPALSVAAVVGTAASRAPS